MPAPTTLDELREHLQQWKGIEIATINNPVSGEGNPRAKIVFIGEAPGKKEDEQGKPFVGPAGKLLEKLLASINLQREDVYITNIVKFRPPDNRDPTAEEIAACFSFLELELSIIKPKVVATLGRHALAQFDKKMSISEVHGTAQVLTESFTLFPLYHPAAALHNPNLRQTLFDDMKALGEYVVSSE